MNFDTHKHKLLARTLLLGVLSTGIPLLSIEAARAADVIFNFKIDSSGTGPFDGDNNPGHDQDATNNIVRTLDIITYKWEYNVSNGAANDVILRATVPDNVELTLPPVCTTGSEIVTDSATGKQSITCNLGTIASGSSGAIDLKARVLGQRRAPSNAFVANGNTTQATGSMRVSNSSSILNAVTTSNLTISAAPKTDLSKQSAYVEGGAKGQDGITDGVVIRYPILLSLNGGGKGGEALTGNISFTDTLTYDGGSKNGQPIPGAKLYTWRPSYGYYQSLQPTLTPGSNSGCNRMGGDPWAYYGGYPNGKINSSYYEQYSSPDYSTTNSGNWACSQAGAGQPIQINITGADTTGNHAPIKDYYGGNTLPADKTYLAVGAIHIWVPVSSITANTTSTGQTTPGQINVRNQLSGFTATGASGQLNQDPLISNDYYNHTLLSTNGAFTSRYAISITDSQTVLPGMSALNGGDGPVMPGQNYASLVYINNNGALPWGAGSILCTAIDNKTQAVTPIAGTPSSAVQNYSTTGDLGVDYRIEYGTGTYATPLDQKKATCRDSDSPGGWNTDIRNVPGGADAVSKVRLIALNPIKTGTTWYVHVNLTARNNYLNTSTPIPIGTRLVETSGFYIPNYPGAYQGELGMPAGWFAGFYQQNDNGYAGWGDRLTMTRAIVRIDKQNTPNQPTISATAGSEVTFKLKSTITATVNPAPVSPNIVIRDILPATMNYVVGSANTVPSSVVTNADGTTTISWNLGARGPNQAVPDITYRAKIRLDAPNNSTAVNTAIIESPDDSSSESSRTRIASVTIGNPASFQIFKEVAQSLVDKDTGITYYLYYANTGSTDVGTSQYIDILPYAGDGRTPATSYTGSSSFSSISGTNAETFEYTNRPQNLINSDPNDSSNQAGGATKWCANLGGTGCPLVNSNITAVRINAPAFNTGLPTRKITLNLTANGNSPNDRYTNRFTGRATGLLGELISNDVFARVKTPPNILLVKRITAVNKKAISTVVPNPATNPIVPDPTTNPNWPANYLTGATNGEKVVPGDEIEYTIYFMNTGDNPAKNLRLCDLIMPNQLFKADKYAVGTGIQFKLGSDPAMNFTNAANAGDRAQFIPAGNPLLPKCGLPVNATNNDGLVVVDVTGNPGTGSPDLIDIPGAITPGNPTSSYGSIRFTTKVK
jgi:uncharacterized repeat protein (TIGR01451 family)